MVLMVFQALPTAEAAKPGSNSNTATGSTPSYAQLYWPNQDAIINQTRASNREDTYSDFAQALTAAEITSGASSYKVGVDVFSAADSRKQFNYGVTTGLSGADTAISELWTLLGGNAENKLTLRTNGGQWRNMELDGAWNQKVIYGAAYMAAYVAANGFVVLKNYTDAWMANENVWMWGSNTNYWNYSLASSLPTPSITGAITIAPFWARLNMPTNPDDTYGVRAGEVWSAKHKGFAVVWKNVLGADGKWYNFALEIDRIIWDDTWQMDLAAGGLSTVRFHYGSGFPTPGMSYAAGMQDMHAWQSTSVTPVAGKSDYFSASSPGSYRAIKSITMTYTKEKFDGTNWVADPSATVYPQIIKKDGSVTGDVLAFNVKPGGPFIPHYPTNWEILVGFAEVWSWFFLPAALAENSLKELLLAVGGEVAVKLLLYQLRYVAPVEDVGDDDWVAASGDYSADIQLNAFDEVLYRGFCWDAVLAPHLVWEINKNAASVKHRLTVSTQIWYGDAAIPADKSTSYTLTNSVIIGPAPVTSDSTTSWLGRTSAGAHTVDCYPVSVSIPGCSDQIGFRAISTGSSDYGYDFMGYYSISNNLANDIRGRWDGTIRVEGWFKMNDALPSAQQAAGRVLNIYVMYPDSNWDGKSDGDFTVRQTIPVPFTTSEFNTWVFKSVLVWGCGPTVKIGIGRPHLAYGGYAGDLIAEWAGIKVIGKASNGVEWRDQWALRTAFKPNNAGDQISPSTTTYSVTLNPFSGTTYIDVTASPVSGSRVAYLRDNEGEPVFGGNSYRVEFGAQYPQSYPHDHELFMEFMAASKVMLWVDPFTPVRGLSVSPTGAQYVNPGGSVKLTATITGQLMWVFVAWVDRNGAALSYDEVWTCVVQSDMYVSSSWRAMTCVAEGTLVTMADGTEVAVEKLHVGDQILGYDPGSRLYCTETIKKVSSAKAPLILNINDGALRVTPYEQPIYVRNSSGEGWAMNPREIQIGWEILDLKNGVWVAVFSLTYEDEITKVYDFQTDGPRTYLANGYLLLDKPRK